MKKERLVLSNIVSVDIGGTYMKYGIIEHTGAIRSKSICPTDANRGGQVLIEKVKRIISMEIEHGKNIIGIGISTAGQVEPRSGSVKFASDNLPGWTGMHIKDILESTFNLPVYVDNDVNAAALGELWLGAGRGCDNLIMLTLGTGIGGAIVYNRKIFYGSNGAAGEFGHINLYESGIPCTCGLEGCYEQYASTNALIRLVKERLADVPDSALNNISELNGERIFRAEQSGDLLAREAIETWIGYIARGLSIIIHSFNPDTIIIGGGVSRQGASFIDRIKDRTKAVTMSSFFNGLSIRGASLFNDAGLIGAAYGVLKYVN